MPRSNLLDPQPRLRAQLLGSIASILVDFGADSAIEAAALISTTLPSNATVRWRIGAGESQLEAVALFDLSLTDPGTVVFPSGWTFNRASAGLTFDATGQLVQVAADTPHYRWDPVTFACLGMLLEVDPLILERRDRNPLTSAEFPVPASSGCQRSPTPASPATPCLSIHTSAENGTQHRDMLRAMGAVGDALWIPETGLSHAELNARSLWGAIAAPGDEPVSTRDSPA